MITVLSLSPAVDKIYVIDNFEAGSLYRVGNSLQSAGGKGINVARVLSLLGTRVEVLGFKAGSTGEWIEKSLFELGTKTDFINVEGQSRTNINIIDKINNRETEILEEGPVIKLQAWEAFLEKFRAVMANTEVLVCSGGLPKGLGQDTYARLIAEAGRFGTKAVLDSSGDVLALGIEAAPYLIKPNIRELSSYFNTSFADDVEIIAACHKIIEKGVQVVVVSLGDQGALLVTGNKGWKALPLEIEAVNTIGSGDSMVAGISKGIAEGLPIEECFRLGCACAVSNTEFLEIGLIDTERVNTLLKNIVIKEI